MGTLVYLADPADIKTVFAGDPRIFHAGEANSMLHGLLGDTSVLVIDDDVHRDRRRLMLAPFHRDAVAPAGRRYARDRRGEHRPWPMGRTFPVASKMSQITLEVILRTVIGASDPVRLAALREVMPRLLTVGPWETLAIANRTAAARPWREWCATSTKPTGCCTRRSPTAVPIRIWPSAPMRWRCWSRHGDDGGMTDQELRDQLMTLLVAGHDTTATGLSWALERLTRHPALLAKAVAAARTRGRSGGDEYLDAVAKEIAARSVRWCSTSGRILKEPVELAGYRLPAGVMVVPASAGACRPPTCIRSRVASIRIACSARR